MQLIQHVHILPVDCETNWRSCVEALRKNSNNQLSVLHSDSVIKCMLWSCHDIKERHGLLLLDGLFLLFEPLITAQSIQFANGADGRQRRQEYDRTFSHDALDSYYSTFNKASFFVKYSCLLNDKM